MGINEEAQKARRAVLFAKVANGHARNGECDEIGETLLNGEANKWLKSKDRWRPGNQMNGDHRIDTEAEEIGELGRGRRKWQRVSKPGIQQKVARENGLIAHHENGQMNGDHRIDTEAEETGEFGRGRRKWQRVSKAGIQQKVARENGLIAHHENGRFKDSKIDGEENKWLRSEDRCAEEVGTGDFCGVRGGRKWKKIVYGGMQEGFEDNHTDSSFLEAMVMNANVVKRDTWTAVRDSVAISQYVCVVAMVGAVWTYSLNGVLEASLLLILDAVLLLLGFMVLLVTTGSISQAVLCRYALYLTFFVSGLYVLGPVFQTLTRSISSDSIWALTVCLLLVHLFFHDYTDSSIKPPASYTTTKASTLTLAASRPTPIDLSQNLAVKKPTSLSGNVSLNASIVASVLIASRLPSRLLVFALLLFSSEFFLLFPLVTHCIKHYSVKLHMWFSCMLIVVTMALIFPLCRLALILFLAVLVFIMFVCPYWLIRIQEYKFEINGPWDEAKLCFDLD